MARTRFVVVALAAWSCVVTGLLTHTRSVRHVAPVRLVREAPRAMMYERSAEARRALTPTRLAAPSSIFLESSGGLGGPPSASFGLLSPATMAQLVRHQSSSDVFRDDPAMAAFLRDFAAGGPMLAMKHLSDSHVTSQLVELLREVNSCPTRYV
mmetsp:Transcript_16245/g.50941  ORF Transcript_16245/g.50941 Transcript_16245/m.50941 type:complete len:154 (-) Transcript_16245:373-834(-)|eukprot:CAMPEP_0197387030 /NCGR_PEP_ID=MMETSP1165-20131217/282_1 /TAXON_ID=284809 /ORGANISM="Chrysocystis fragilis, Strain CCMP3189" /LENGTH=153 /DNA_ID=CAMNT_0042912327 /DNA_START=110 /DNA_END=571 /DNA_ORIENTATION=+